MKNKKHLFILEGALALSVLLVCISDGVSIFLLGAPAFILLVSACIRTFRGEKCESDFALAFILIGFAAISLSLHFTLYPEDLTDKGKDFISGLCAGGILLSAMSGLLYFTHQQDVQAVEKNEACAER